MDANSDEASRCVALASAALKAGEIERCKRLLSKAERMYPGMSATAALRGKLPLPAREATEAMISAVRAVSNCDANDYYAVLGAISREATDSQLKKLYRKKLLAVHPDKNIAPGAEDAFKLVTKAWETLSDPDKRARYDRFGVLDDQQQHTTTTMRRRRSTNNTHPFMNMNMNNNYHAEDVDLDEIFSMLFNTHGGGGNAFGPQGRRRANFRNRRHRRHEDATTTHQLELSPLQAIFWVFGILGTFSMFSIFMSLLSALVNGG